MLHDEFLYFRENFASLLAKYEGKYIILKDREVKGSFATLLDAYSWGNRNFTPGTFFIDKCIKGRDTYVARIRSWTKNNSQ